MSDRYSAPNQIPKSHQLEPKIAPSHGVSTRPEIIQVNRRSSPSSGENHPFHLSVSKDGAIYYWNVSSVGSTITDGTNGASLAIGNMDTDTAFTAAKYIVADATVTSLVLTGLAISAVDDPEEVDTAGTPAEQDTIRYLIGKVDVVDSAPTKTQYALTAARLTYGFLNAKLVRVFEFAPTHLG
mgnify:CR=1 FL=1|tara:strand:- start:17575 stop:18123 length:549 start_codon:yes stop_codon:yes gene_type:complete